MYRVQYHQFGGGGDGMKRARYQVLVLRTSDNTLTRCCSIRGLASKLGRLAEKWEWVLFILEEGVILQHQSHRFRAGIEEEGKRIDL